MNEWDIIKMKRKLEASSLINIKNALHHRKSSSNLRFANAIILMQLYYEGL